MRSPLINSYDGRNWSQTSGSFEVHDRRDTPIIVYLTVCTKRRKPIWQIQQRMNSCELRGEARLWLVGRYVNMPNHLHLFCASDKLWRDELRLVPNFSFRGSKFGTTQRSSLNALEMGRILKSHSARHWLNRSTPRSATSFLGYATAEGRKLQSEMAIRRRKSGACGPCEACVRLAIPRRDERAAVVFLNFGTTRRSSLHESAFRNCTFVE